MEGRQGGLVGRDWGLLLPDEALEFARPVSPRAVPPAVCIEGGVHPRGDHRNAKQGEGARSQGLSNQDPISAGDSSPRNRRDRKVCALLPNQQTQQITNYSK